LTTNKWKIGHTFGASGILSMELAILMMQNNTFVSVPFAKAQIQTKPIRKVLINAVGFGGNAVSVLLSL
jgi:3-oxoacyl-(acyl-carrier-protein) synthase